jgi:hypothetical protein
MVAVLVIAAVVVGIAAVAYVASSVFNPDETAKDMTVAVEGEPTVQLDGEVLMLSHNGLHHPVGSSITASSGRRLLASTTVKEDNTFSMAIPADIRGEIEVGLGLHDGAKSVVVAEGTDMHAVVMYNPVNNYFA